MNINHIYIRYRNFIHRFLAPLILACHSQSELKVMTPLWLDNQDPISAVADVGVFIGLKPEMCYVHSGGHGGLKLKLNLASVSLLTLLMASRMNAQDCPRQATTPTGLWENTNGHGRFIMSLMSWIKKYDVTQSKFTQESTAFCQGACASYYSTVPKNK